MNNWHWTERDVMGWSRGRLGELLGGAQLADTPQAGAKVTGVQELEGARIGGEVPPMSAAVVLANAPAHEASEGIVRTQDVPPVVTHGRRGSRQYLKFLELESLSRGRRCPGPTPERLTALCWRNAP